MSVPAARPAAAADLAPAAGPHRPGPFAWVVIATGWIVIGVVIAGVLRESERTHPGSWATWVIGAALVHDLIVLPVVLLVGLGLGRLLRPAWRAPIRAALTVAVVLAVVTWPTVRRFGARPDNPSLLPLDAGRNLAVVAVGLAVGALGFAVLRAGRRGLLPSEVGRDTRAPVTDDPTAMDTTSPDKKDPST